MTDRRNASTSDRQELVGLLSVSGSLAGLCITVVALMNTFDKTRAGVSAIDDVFAFCGAGFLLCTYLIFWALRSDRPSLSTTLLKIVDAIFLLTLTSMTLAGFAVVYTVW
jgi:hypothetical protein